MNLKERIIEAIDKLKLEYDSLDMIVERKKVIHNQVIEDCIKVIEELQ